MTLRRVLVVGEPRSGTTLLLRVLGAQRGAQAFASRFGPAFNACAALELDVDAPMTERQAHVVRAGSGDRTPIAAGTRFAEWQRARQVVGVASDTDLVIDRVHRPLSVALALLAVDPELRVVQIVRDPRDVALSRAYVNAHEQLEQTLIAWTRAVRIGDSASHEAHFVRIRFEDLVRTPERALETIATVLGRPLSTDVAFASPANSSFDASADGFDPRAVERWRERIDQPRVRFAGWACRAEIERLGYPAAPSLTLAERRRFVRRWWLAQAIAGAARARRRLSTTLLPPLD